MNLPPVPSSSSSSSPSRSRALLAYEAQTRHPLAPGHGGARAPGLRDGGGLGAPHGERRGAGGNRSARRSIRSSEVRPLRRTIRCRRPPRSRRRPTASSAAGRPTAAHLLRARPPERRPLDRRRRSRSRRRPPGSAPPSGPRGPGRRPRSRGVRGPPRDASRCTASRVLRYSGFAGHDAPLAAYGVTTCPSALGPVIAGVLEEHPLLPRPVAGGLSNAELAALEVSAPAASRCSASGPRPGCLRRRHRHRRPGLAGLPRVAPARSPGRLVVARPRCAAAALFGLLVLTAGLAAVALRQLRREQELARLRADFTSSVSHELRTPLTQILLFARDARAGPGDGEDERRQALAIIVQEARRLAHLVENVLQLSRAERRLVRVRPEPRPLAPLLREIVERFAPLGGYGAVRLRTELDEDAGRHRCTRRRCTRSCINLLDNAVKYGGTAARSRSAPALAAGRARIEVEDAGAGIPPADRSRVWEPFVRLDGRPRWPAAGSASRSCGSWSRRTAGECWVEDGAGGGARFVVELPGGRRRGAARPERIERRRRDGPRAHRRGQPEPGARPPHQPRVRGPRGRGRRRTATAGLARARTRGHDLIVLDLMLPGAGRIPAARDPARGRADHPVLVLTARGDEADKVRGLRDGADDYVTKPFALRELLARVAALLRRARTQAVGADCARSARSSWTRRRGS